LGAFLLGALPGTEIDHERDPAQRFVADHRPADQDRHPVPVPVHVLLLEGLEGAAAAQLRQRVPALVCPLRGRDPLIGDLPGGHVVPAVADDGQERVIGLIDLLLAVDHHAEHVRIPQPVQQVGALRRRHLQFLPVPDVRGHVGEMQQNPGDTMAGVTDRLTGVVHE